MKRPTRSTAFVTVFCGLGLAALLAVPACGDANKHGIGAQCAATSECAEANQVCLPFKGGYCGLAGCVADAGCPAGSACIAHSDGVKYCFLICANKPDCNANRSAEFESNCSSSVSFVDGTQGRKACVPPS